MGDVVTWRPEYREDFERLNRVWIEAYFAVEPSDLAVFRDPEEAIVRPGGEIFFVVDDEGHGWRGGGGLHPRGHSRRTGPRAGVER